MCFDRGKKPRVAPKSSDLSSHWLNVVASMVDKGSPNHVCISSGPIMVLEQIANLSVVNSAYEFKSCPLRLAMSPVGRGGGFENLLTVKGSGVQIPIMAYGASLV